MVLSVCNSIWFVNVYKAVLMDNAGNKYDLITFILLVILLPLTSIRISNPLPLEKHCCSSLPLCNVAQLSSPIEQTSTKIHNNNVSLKTCDQCKYILFKQGISVDPPISISYRSEKLKDICKRI